MVMSSPTRIPPVSRAAFHVKPKSLRLILVLAETPIRVFPQGSFDRQFSLARDVDAGRLEVQGGKLFNVEEIGALQVSIALFIAGLNGGGFDGGLDAIVCRVRFIPDQHSRNPGEVAFHVGDHHVLDLELSRGMSRVDVPGGGCGLCWSYCRVRHGRHPFCL